ncbi:uncharacterized protein LOC143172646 [Aptenodytes patagonicus]|uniref:uncharacterized protein LOC143172646 n=1 Tax=Aptenodytes patagonicus TaxID=9234 RepID=UPI003FA0D9DB
MEERKERWDGQTVARSRCNLFISNDGRKEGREQGGEEEEEKKALATPLQTQIPLRFHSSKSPSVAPREVAWERNTAQCWISCSVSLNWTTEGKTTALNKCASSEMFIDTYCRRTY